MLAIGLSIGALAARSRPFAPAALFAAGDVGVWYDPSDLGSMFQDGAGSIPAAIGQPVGRVIDKSGRGNHALAPGASARPILREANGRRYLEFDGIDDRLGFPPLTGASGWSLCAAARADSLPATANPYEASAFIIGSWLAGFDRDVSLGLRNDGGGAAVSAYGEDGTGGAEARAGAVATGTDHVAFAEANATRLLARLNGGVPASAAARRDDLLIGAIGQSGGSRYLHGRVYGVVAIDRPLAQAEARQLQRFLAAQAGLQL